jgi:protein-disulfide isomerase
LGSGRFAERVKRDFDGGQRSGVTGTPTLFINNVRYTGELDLDSMLKAIEGI